MLSKLVSALHESGSAPEMPLSLALLQQDWMRHYIVEHRYVVCRGADRGSDGGSARQQQTANIALWFQAEPSPYRSHLDQFGQCAP